MSGRRGGCTTAVASARPRSELGNRFVSREARCHPDRPRYGDGLCAPCYRADRRPQRRAAARRRHLGRYRLTEQEYEFLLQQQHGCCAICHEPETRTVRGKTTALIVDHEHDTDEIKGLLCYRCNLALGYLRESPRVLRAALDYVVSFRERTA